MLLFFVLYLQEETLIYYGNEGKDRVVLQELRKRKPQMDGALSGMRGVEYHGGTDCGDRKAVP